MNCGQLETIFGEVVAYFYLSFFIEDLSNNNGEATLFSIEFGI